MSFSAKFPGRCIECGQRFEVGTLIDLTPERKALHASCNPNPAPSRRSSAGYNASSATDTSTGTRSQPFRRPGSALASSVLTSGSGPRIAAMAFNRHNSEQLERELQNSVLFEGSDEQKVIWEEMLTGERNIIINACAGGAKTSTAQQGILRMIRDLDASAKACTYHSLGYAICRKNFPALTKTKPNEYKLRDILQEWERPRGTTDEIWQAFLRDTEKLVKLSKSYLLDGTDRARLEQLADFFGIDVGGREDLVYDAVPKVIRACLDDTSQVDFADMIFLPAMLDLKGDTFDLLIADEVQDVSPDQRKLFQLACPSGRIMGIGDSWQCQPKGTQVYKTCVGYVPIESIKPGDALLTYIDGTLIGFGKGKPKSRPQGRKVLKVAHRKYDGKMIRIKAGDYQHNCTPEHKCLIRMNAKYGWAVYVAVNEAGTHARVGVTRSHKNPAQSVANRARGEKAKRAWILDIFDNREDAYLLECQVAYEFGIPQLCFNRQWEVKKNTIHTQRWFDEFWEAFPSNIDNLKRCLIKLGRIYEYPFYKNGTSRRGSLYTSITEACNLISGWMYVLTTDCTRGSVNKTDWKLAEVSSYPYKGVVYSLELDKRQRGHPVYVADGIVTHNCLYSWRGADLDSMEQTRDMLAALPRGVVELSLTMTRRCPKSHVALAKQVCGEGVIEAMPEAPEGVIRLVSLNSALEEMRAGDMVLCRVNKHLIPTAYKLIKKGIKAIVRGRDIGAGLEALIKKLVRGNLGSSVSDLTTALYDWRRRELAKLQPLGEKGAGRVQQVEDSADTVVELCDDADTVSDVLHRISQIFSDFDDDGKPIEAVVLGTIHKLKGLQAPRTYILAPELLPHPMAGPNFYKGELCALYVALTRAKWGDGKEGELVFIGEIPSVLRWEPPQQGPVAEELYAGDGEDIDTNENYDDDDKQPEIYETEEEEEE